MIGRPGRWVGAGVGAWAAYAWGAQCALPAVAWRRGPAGGRRIALTFDDGPDPEATPRLLELLAARGVRATFFLIGERAARSPDVVRAIRDAGHEVGTHTWRHRNAWLLPPGASALEITEGARILEDILGDSPRLYRPPWGIVNAASLTTARRLGPRAPAAPRRPGAGRLRYGALGDRPDAPGLPGAPERLLAMMPGLLDVLAACGYAAVPVGELLAGAASPR